MQEEHRGREEGSMTGVSGLRGHHGPHRAGEPLRTDCGQAAVQSSSGDGFR